MIMVKDYILLIKILILMVLFDFNMTIDIMKELLNVNIQFIILGKKDLFKSGQMYMNGYYFKNCMIHIRFNV